MNLVEGPTSAIYTEQVDAVFRQMPIALAVNIVNARLEHVARHERESRVADQPMRNWHRPISYRSAACRQTTTLHEIVPFAKFSNEARSFFKVITSIRIAHQ